MEGDDTKTIGGLEASEAAAAAVAKTPHRVTLDHLRALVVNEELFRAGNDGLTTIVVLTVRNGFSVIGMSAAADPENFNADLGLKIARDDAISKLWPLEGYLLKQRLFEQTVSEEEPYFPAETAEIRPDPAQTEAVANTSLTGRVLPGATVQEGDPPPRAPEPQEAADTPEGGPAIGLAMADELQKGTVSVPRASIGRIVLFSSAFRADMGGLGDWVPAIITAVHSDTLVNLCVFRDNAPTASFTSVEFGETVGPNSPSMVWKWPPRV